MISDDNRWILVKKGVLNHFYGRFEDSPIGKSETKVYSSKKEFDYYTDNDDEGVVEIDKDYLMIFWFAKTYHENLFIKDFEEKVVKKYCEFTDEQIQDSLTETIEYELLLLKPSNENRKKVFEILFERILEKDEARRIMSIDRGEFRPDQDIVMIEYIRKICYLNFLEILICEKEGEHLGTDFESFINQYDKDFVIGNRAFNNKKMLYFRSKIATAKQFRWLREQIQIETEKLNGLTNNTTSITPIENLKQEQAQTNQKLKWTGTPSQFGFIIDLLIQGGYIQKPITSFAKDSNIYLSIFDIDTTPTTLTKEVSETTNSLEAPNRIKFKIPPKSDLTSKDKTKEETE